MKYIFVNRISKLINNLSPMFLQSFQFNKTVTQFLPSYSSFHIISQTILRFTTSGNMDSLTWYYMALKFHS